MKHNVIILTSGLSGSSVLTSLIARAGYWTGDSTKKKPEYDTFENAELVELNVQLFQAAGLSAEYQTRQFSPQALSSIESLYSSLDRAPFQGFVKHCNDHRPWIWKDPRLWLTIRFWKSILDLEDCRFVLLTRDPTQCWVSTTLRRQIVAYKSFRRYEALIQQSIFGFFQENSISPLHLRYEDLILRPQGAIERLNRFLGTGLVLDDLKAIYHKPLYKLPKSPMDLVKAALIYLKNYSERIELAPASIKSWPAQPERNKLRSGSLAP